MKPRRSPEGLIAEHESGAWIRLRGGGLSEGRGVIGEWMGRFDAAWVVVRPDRFVFALGGSEPGQISDALAALHRQVGRPARPQGGLAGRTSERAAAA